MRCLHQWCVPAGCAPLAAERVGRPSHCSSTSDSHGSLSVLDALLNPPFCCVPNPLVLPVCPPSNPRINLLLSSSACPPYARHAALGQACAMRRGLLGG
eukprot:3753770-Rhodomonas_salina.2